MESQTDSLPGSSKKFGDNAGEKICCLFCYKKFDKVEDKNLERFTNSAELWLGKKISTRCLQKNDECGKSGGCCPNCEILVVEFCQAFDKWKEAEAKVEDKMEGLLNKMKLANRGPQSLKEIRKRFEEGEGRLIREFREDLIQAGSNRGQQQQTLNLNEVQCKVEESSTTHDRVIEYFLGWMVTYSAVLCLGLESSSNHQILEGDNPMGVVDDFVERREEIPESSVASNEDSFLDELIGMPLNPVLPSVSAMRLDGEVSQVENITPGISDDVETRIPETRNKTPVRTTVMSDSNTSCKNCLRVFASPRSLKQHARFCSHSTPKQITNKNCSTGSITPKASKRKTIKEPQSSIDFQIARCSMTLAPTTQQTKRPRNCATTLDHNRLMSLMNSSTFNARYGLNRFMSILNTPNTHDIPSSNSEHESFPQKNPLLARVVFDKLLKFDFSFRDMKQIRLVCKSWYEYSLRKWRSNFTIRLGPAVQQLWGDLEMPRHLCKTWSANNYIDCYLTSFNFREVDTCPYKKFILKGFCFRSDNTSQLADSNPFQVNYLDASMFWPIIGKEMKHLTIEDCTFSSKDQMDGIFTQDLRNLETLAFKNCKMSPPTESNRLFINNRQINEFAYVTGLRRNRSLKSISVCGILPMDLSVLLINSPNILSIQLDSKMQDKSHFYQKLNQICNLNQLKINQLHLNLQKEDTNGSVLRTQDIPILPLERLSYASVPIQSGNLSTTTTGISDVIALTAKFSDTLKILEVFQPPVQNSRTFLKLTTKMNNLEEIYCYGNVFESLEFVNQMPKLKTLYLDFKCLNNLDKTFKWMNGSDYLERLKNNYFPQGRRDLINTIKHQTPMRNLVCFHIDIDLNSGCWVKVVKWMPNLKTLEATLGGDGFRAVCKYLPNLEELVLLYGSSVGDDEITGIRSESAHGERNAANLTNIKGLKKLLMKRTCGASGTPGIFQESCGLQDLSIFEGFLKMTNLEEVQIQASAEMTENAITALKEHVPKVKVMRYYDSSSHRYGECCKVTEFLKSVNTANNRRSEDS